MTLGQASASTQSCRRREGVSVMMKTMMAGDALCRPAFLFASGDVIAGEKKPRQAGLFCCGCQRVICCRLLFMATRSSLPLPLVASRSES